MVSVLCYVIQLFVLYITRILMFNDNIVFGGTNGSLNVFAAHAKNNVSGLPYHGCSSTTSVSSNSSGGGSGTVSPRANPFSSVSPAHNPFMSFVEKQDGDLWKSFPKEGKDSSKSVKSEPGGNSSSGVSSGDGIVSNSAPSTSTSTPSVFNFTSESVSGANEAKEEASDAVVKSSDSNSTTETKTASIETASVGAPSAFATLAASKTAFGNAFATRASGGFSSFSSFGSGAATDAGVTSTFKTTSNPFGALKASGAVIGASGNGIVPTSTGKSTAGAALFGGSSSTSAANANATAAKEDADSGEECDADGEAETGNDDGIVEETATAVTGTNGVAFVPQATDKKPETGEEGELVVMQVRSKVFRMGSKGGSEPVQKADSCGSPSSPATAVDAKRDEINTKSSKGPMEWIEVGTGPLRLLSTDSDDSNEKSFRLVMRREVCAGGSGTKLLLNILLQPKCVKHSKLGDKAVRISCMEYIEPSVKKAAGSPGSREGDGDTECNGAGTGAGVFEPVTYLLRVKNSTVSNVVHNNAYLYI